MNKLKILKSIFILILLIGLITNGAVQTSAATDPIKATSVYYKGIQDLSYIQLDGIKDKKIKDNINYYLRQVERSHFLAYTELMKAMKEDYDEKYCAEYPSSCQYTYTTKFKIDYQDSNYVSIIVTSDTFTGGAHGNRLLESYNFNIKTGKRILLTDIVKPAKAQQTKQYIFNYLKNNKIIFDDMTVKNIKLNKDSVFTFSKTGIKVYYQSYEVAAYAYGNPEVNVPKSIYKY